MKNPESRQRKSARKVLRACLKKLHCERGQSLIELAFSVPFFALMIFGSVEIARVIYVSVEVSDAALAGVQYGTRNPLTAADPSGIQNAVSADAPNLLVTANSSLSCICSDGSASTCQPTDCATSNIETILTVKTESKVIPLVHLPGLPDTFTVHGQAIQKVLQ